VLRMGAMDVPVPFSPALEDLTVPTPEARGEQRAQACAGELIMPHDVIMPAARHGAGRRPDRVLAEKPGRCGENRAMR
jgi:hypothetical protein